MTPFLLVCVLALIVLIWPIPGQGGQNYDLGVLINPDPAPTPPPTMVITSCPSEEIRTLLAVAKVYTLRPVQAFDQKFHDLFEEEYLWDGTRVRVMDEGDFCLFQYEGLVFGIPGTNTYSLQQWLVGAGLGAGNACQVIWLDCDPQQKG